MFLIFESRNSGIEGEKNRFQPPAPKKLQQLQLRWSKEVTQIANCLGSWEMLECKCWTNICNAILVLNSPWFTMIHHSPTVHPREKSGGLQVYLVWFSLVSTWRRRNRGIPWMPLGPLEWRRETSALCHLKEISHWSCDGLSWNKSQRKIPKSTTNVKEVTFLAALQSLRATVGFIKVLCQHRQPLDFVIVDASPNVIMEKEWIIIEAICQPKRILLTNLNIPGGLHICRCERHWRWWEYVQAVPDIHYPE